MDDSKTDDVQHSTRESDIDKRWEEDRVERSPNASSLTSIAQQSNSYSLYYHIGG